MRFDLGAVARELTRAVGPVLPVAVTALTGNPLAGAVVGRLAEQYGVPMDAPDLAEQLQSAMISDPEAAAKLEKIAADLEVKQLETDARMAEIEAKDRADARAVHGSSTFNRWLTVIIVLMFGAALMALFFVEPPQATRDMVNITYGTLQGAFVSAVAYWLGSSNGSSEKQGMIGRMIRG